MGTGEPLATGMLPTIWAAFLWTPIFPFIVSHQLLPGPALKGPQPPPPAASSPHPRCRLWKLRASWWCQDSGEGRDEGKPCLLQLTPPVLRAPSTPAPGHAPLHHSLRPSSSDPFIPGPAGCKAHPCCPVTFTRSVIHEAPATLPSHTPRHIPDTPLFLWDPPARPPQEEPRAAAWLASACQAALRSRVSWDPPHRPSMGWGLEGAEEDTLGPEMRLQCCRGPRKSSVHFEL